MYCTVNLHCTIVQLYVRKQRVQAEELFRGRSRDSVRKKIHVLLSVRNVK